MAETIVMENAIAVVGMGVRFPGAPDLSALGRMMRTGSVQVQPVPPQRWNHAAVPSPDSRQANRVVTVIRGIAMNNDGCGAGPLTPLASGQAAAIEATWPERRSAARP